MFRQSSILMKPKTLQQMFRKLKLAGAHPDILWGIDAQKAQHNGEEMIRLETLMHQRESSGHSGQQRGSNAPEHFLFWLRPDGTAAAGPRHQSSNITLRAVQCTITPYSQSQVVKQQLRRLFEEAGIMEEFELATSDGVDMSLDGVLRYAREQQREHAIQTGSLYIRGDKAVENLRRFAVLLVVEEAGMSYLVTLPETQPAHNGSGGAAGAYTAPAMGSGAMHRPTKGIIGPNGEIDPDVQTFMTERGLRPFDLRMGGGHSSVERFVTAFERIERVYEVHRGRALRSSVCLVMSLKSPDCYVAPDGCIVLSVQRMPAWEEFLLGLPQEVWADCVRKHLDWRVGNAPKLQERRRRLIKVADSLHFHRVTVESQVSGTLFWQDALIERMLKDEVTIRRAVQKYKLSSDLLKRRGEIVFCDGLYSALQTQGTHDRKEIGFRIGGDGKVFFNQRAMSTGQMLRVLKDNIKRIETFQRHHDKVIASLEHVSRNVPIDFSVDTEWKYREEANLINCLERFTRMIKQNEAQLGAFLHATSATAFSSSPSNAPSTNVAAKARTVWIISDKFDTMPSGVVYVPYDVDFESIKSKLLGGK